MNCGDCILLRAALRNRRSRLLFANYIRAFRTFSRSKNLTAVYAYRKAQETQFHRKLSPNLKSFFGDVFSQNKENKRRRTSVLRAKFDAVFGKAGPNIKLFFGDIFSQDKASKPPLYMHTARRKKRSFTGNSARISAHFSAMFFRKTRKISDGVLSVLRARFDAVFGKLSPKPQIIFRRCFFRKTRKMSDGVLSVLRAKFDAVLRKNSPKNQISIMSASFFFAISSISLTYLSVIF